MFTGSMRLIELFVACGMLCMAGCSQLDSGVMHSTNGIVWQPHNANVNPHGGWERLGVKTLLVQWTVVDDLAFVPGTQFPQAPLLPDWQRIADEPWATEVILGLAGRFDEGAARSQAVRLAQESVALAKLSTPLHVVGWFFPVELDPTWPVSSALISALADLPRPLWISAYDSANLGASAMADYLEKVVPSDVGVFFQDGVGVYARDARVAREYADAVSQRLGAQRIRIIAEAFRPSLGAGFRAATAAELKLQLTHYGGYQVYLFEGPSYVSDQLIHELTTR